MKHFLIFSLIVITMACQKAQRDEDTSINTCEDIALAQTIFADAYKHVRIAANNAEGISDAETTISTIYGCEEILVDTLSNVRNIIIDYKYIGCEGLGIDRYGRLMADFFGKFGEEGSAVDILFSNYFFGEYEVNGKIRIIFKEINSSDQEVQTFYLQNGTINDGNSTMTWTASQTWTVSMKAGLEQYSISGNNNGVNRKGNIFNAEMTSLHLMSEDCLYPTSGKQDVDVRNLSLRKLDFGNGTCNNLAEVAINGANYNLVIP